MCDCTTYPEGQCTNYVCSNWTDCVGPYWGNADQWVTSALAAGYKTSTEPQIGAIAVWAANAGGASSVGHVALVVQMFPLVVFEQNWDDQGTIDRREIFSLEGITFIYPKTGVITEDDTVTYLLAGDAATPADLAARRVKVHEWVHLSGSHIDPSQLSEAVMDELLAQWVTSGGEAVLAAILGA